MQKQWRGCALHSFRIGTAILSSAFPMVSGVQMKKLARTISVHCCTELNVECLGWMAYGEALSLAALACKLSVFPQGSTAIWLLFGALSLVYSGRQRLYLLSCKCLSQPGPDASLESFILCSLLLFLSLSLSPSALLMQMPPPSNSC